MAESLKKYNKTGKVSVYFAVGPSGMLTVEKAESVFEIVEYVEVEVPVKEEKKNETVDKAAEDAEKESEEAEKGEDATDKAADEESKGEDAAEADAEADELKGEDAKADAAAEEGDEDSKAAAGEEEDAAAAGEKDEKEAKDTKKKVKKKAAKEKPKMEKVTAAQRLLELPLSSSPPRKSWSRQKPQNSTDKPYFLPPYTR